jgi:protein-S-isoprenylcysteine O-methyltransferase Ste14
MDIRLWLFNHRSYTPIPLLVIALILAEPTWLSFLAGFVLALGGELLRIWGVAHAGSITRTTTGTKADELVMTGPYAYVRNPLYWGNFFMMVGACIAAWPWMPWMLFIVLAFFVFQYGLIISLEEEFLRGKFGELYRQYCRHVPRIFPRFRPYRSGQNRKPSLAAALKSELSTFLNFFGTFLLIFLRWKLLGS